MSEKDQNAGASSAMVPIGDLPTVEFTPARDAGHAYIRSGFAKRYAQITAIGIAAAIAAQIALMIWR